MRLRKDAETARVRECICTHTPFGLSLSEMSLRRMFFLRKTTLSESSRKKVALRLCSFVCSRRVAGTSDVAGHSDRHVCDDEESHHEDLQESDHVHEDHDDQCPASGSEACLVMFSPFPQHNLIVFRVCFGLYGVAASSFIGLQSNSSMSDCVYPRSCRRIWYFSSSK